jgi:hypothetical protein
MVAQMPDNGPMPRQNRRRADRTERAPLTTLGEQRESWRGVDYAVRTVTGTGGRVYRCPGCDQEVRSGGHVVAWPVADADAADRRHWHAVCWGARDRRAPSALRGRSAPRY